MKICGVRKIEQFVKMEKCAVNVSRYYKFEISLLCLIINVTFVDFRCVFDVVLMNRFYEAMAITEHIVPAQLKHRIEIIAF